MPTRTMSSRDSGKTSAPPVAAICLSGENPAPRSIFTVFSKTGDVFKDAPTRIQMVSPGTIIYEGLGSLEFLVNVFVSEESLGAPIYTNCGEHICLVGMVSRTHPYPDKIQTEGFGLPISFILEKIKEKTGLDISAEIQQKDK